MFNISIDNWFISMSGSISEIGYIPQSAFEEMSPNEIGINISIETIINIFNE